MVDIRVPATQALRKLVTHPAIKALRTTLARSVFLSGAKAPSPPNWIPIDPGLANPQSAKVERA